MTKETTPEVVKADETEVVEDKKKEPVHYVDGKLFYKLICDRKLLLAELDEGEKLPISNELGQMILDIASNLTYHRKFIKYSYKEDLIGDAIENCIRYFDNFNIEKSQNPFAYFTQISYYAFLRRITKEYKLDDLKELVVNQSDEYGNPYNLQDHDLYGNYPNPSVDFMNNDDIFVNGA